MGRAMVRTAGPWLALAATVSLLNLLVSVTVVTWRSSAPPPDPPTRLLLSVEYPDQDTSTTTTEPPPEGEGEGEEVRLELAQGVHDKSRMFKSHMFAVSGSAWTQLSAQHLVCLATQTSLDRLDEVVEAAAAWGGPLSVAVFGPAAELALALAYIRYLRSCHPGIRSQVSFHLVYPVAHPGLLHLDT